MKIDEYKIGYKHRMSWRDTTLKTFQNIVVMFEFMMTRRMVFREIISLIRSPFLPFYFELLLLRIPMATTQLWKIPPHSASAADETMFFNVWHSVKIGALYLLGYAL